MNNSHIYPITCQTGRSYLELLLMRLRWADSNLASSGNLGATVEKRRIGRAPSIWHLRTWLSMGSLNGPLNFLIEHPLKKKLDKLCQHSISRQQQCLTKHLLLLFAYINYVCYVCNVCNVGFVRVHENDHSIGQQVHSYGN